MRSTFWGIILAHTDCRRTKEEEANGPIHITRGCEKHVLRRIGPPGMFASGRDGVGWLLGR